MSIQSFEAYPQLHQETLFQIRDDLDDEFPRFLSLFSEHSKTLLSTIHTSLANNDLEQVKIALHSFRGMCGSMGATRVFHLCKQAEIMTTAEQLDAQHVLIARIETELLELNAVIQQALQNSITG